MLYETVDREKINEMVQRFYANVLEDEILSPYFTRALGSDLEGGKWHEHLNTLKGFWLLMMNGESGYRGDPFPPHAFLGQMYRETFERWLELFKEVVDSMFIPEIADRFYKKADILAEQFIENLGIDDEEED
jgi:hemoglobin